LLGRRYLWQAGRGVLPFGLTMGKLVAFISIPAVLPLIFGPLIAQLLPGFLRDLVEAAVGPCFRYRLTNRRVVVERPLQRKEERSVSLDRFDEIQIVVLPGQEWYPAGDLVFKKGGVETFRLEGVRWPEAFRRSCLRAHQAHTGVNKALGVAV